MPDVTELPSAMLASDVAPVTLSSVSGIICRLSSVSGLMERGRSASTAE